MVIRRRPRCSAGPLAALSGPAASGVAGLGDDQASRSAQPAAAVRNSLVHRSTPGNRDRTRWRLAYVVGVGWRHAVRRIPPRHRDLPDRSKMRGFNIGRTGRWRLSSDDVEQLLLSASTSPNGHRRRTVHLRQPGVPRLAVRHRPGLPAGRCPAGNRSVVFARSGHPKPVGGSGGAGPGGAEAMMIMDQRVVATSAVCCIGTPCYCRDAPTPHPSCSPQLAMQPAYAKPWRSSRVARFQTYVQKLHLDYGVNQVNEVTLPAYASLVRTTAAHQERR